MIYFNSSRYHLEQWLRAAATKGTGPDFRVLDAGAGESQYRYLFDHVTYESADFGKVDKHYGAPPTYACDLLHIPVEDGRFDQVICSQVLEHVSDPISVLRELRRVVKPGGEIYASAPLFYAEHEVPYDFYRYTQFGWQHMAAEAGLEVRDLDWLEGYYGTLAYQLGVAARALPTIWIPLRVVFLVVARVLAASDIRRRRTDIGQPKNYRAVLRRPLA